LVFWIQEGKMFGIRIIYCVEPDQSKWPENLPCYLLLTDVPEQLKNLTDVVVDCTTKGQGAKNLELYKRFGLSAVFQNGEETTLCELFHQSLPIRTDKALQYLKITRCSGLMACSVIQPLIAIAKIERI
jgi:hypothetical protein